MHPMIIRLDDSMVAVHGHVSVPGTPTYAWDSFVFYLAVFSNDHVFKI